MFYLPLLPAVFFSAGFLSVNRQAVKNYQHSPDRDAAQGTGAERNNNILSAISWIILKDKLYLT
jgi:hypothetical protein